MHDQFVKILVLLSLFGGSLSAALDYSTAAQRVLEYSFPLKSSETTIEIRQADAWQAALYPNPSVYLQYDSFGGNKSYRGWDEAGFSLSLTQPLVLGGKRAHAIAVSGTQVCAAAWDLEIQKQNILYTLSQSFIDAANAQEKLHLTEQQFSLAQETLLALKDKREKGKATLLELKRGEISLHSNQIALERAKSNFEGSKRKIAALWGACEADFSEVAFDLFRIEPPIPLGVLSAQLDQTPEIAKAHSERWTASSATALEKARRIPDVAVSASLCACNHWDDYYFSVGLSLPLPLFDCNQAGIYRAEWSELQSIYGLESLQSEMQNKLVSSYQQWQDTYRQAITLKELSSATANEALHETQNEYDQGRILLEDLVEAKKMVLEVRADFIDAATEYQRAKVEVLRVAADIPTEQGGTVE